jgi:uncharacterized protein (TIGR03437 family)
MVRAEGQAELLGDLVLECAGGTPGAVVNTSLSVLLPVAITNRLNTDSTASGVQLLVGGASGPPGLVASGAITFNGISFSVPATRSIELRLRNLRANVSQLGNAANGALQARISVNAPSGLTLTATSATVALVNPGLLASYASTGIRCSGSPAPSTISMSGLFSAEASRFSTRLTEGFATAFQPRDAASDSGTRFLVRYTGLPAGARLFVPDIVAGSTAAQPTAGGDLGLAQSAGQFLPGAPGLLLARVLATDDHGAGGVLATLPAGGSAPVTLDSASEIALVNGSAMVVYEVLSADPQRQESTQFPTFLALSNAPAGISGQETVSLAPVSVAAYATGTDPVPRFTAVAPASDCSVLDDCDASYFPKFAVVAQPIRLTATADGKPPEYAGYIAVQNQGGGVFTWTAEGTYQTGSGWLLLNPTSGTNNGTVRVSADPTALKAGTYQATVTIQAGSLGSRAVPVTLNVVAGPPPVVIDGVVNAATFAPGPLAAGSLASVMGSRLSGKNVSITFDGTAITPLYLSDSQINLQIPTRLAGQTSTRLVVTADGVASAPQTVDLAPLSPGIFGILNQDNSLNQPAAPAPPASVLQVFATGLPASGTVRVQIADRTSDVPIFPAPGLAGVEQFNIPVPDGLSPISTTLAACANGSDGQTYCSPPAKLSLGQ